MGDTQVNGGGSFSASWGSKTPEPIRLKIGMYDYVHSPTHMQNTVAATNGGGGGMRIWAKLYHRVFFFIIFFWEAWIFAQCTQKRVSVANAFL